jgi:hypothetical protein
MPLRLPHPMTIPRVMPRLYAPAGGLVPVTCYGKRKKLSARSKEEEKKKKKQQTFYIITRPGDGVSNAWIDAHGAKDSSHISNRSSFGT